jgi:hypothetical protein
LTTLRAEANRDGSPVSARITAAPTGDADQGGQAHRVEHGDHPGLGVGQPRVGVLPVGQDQPDTFQGAGPLRGHPARIGQRREERPHDPVIEPGHPEPGQTGPRSRGERVHTTHGQCGQVRAGVDDHTQAGQPRGGVQGLRGSGQGRRPAAAEQVADLLLAAGRLGHQAGPPGA